MIAPELFEALQNVPDAVVRRKEPLAHHVPLRVGGPADGWVATFTEKALVGVSAQLPSPFGDKVRIHSGLELAAHLRSHGGDVMTRWICVDSPDCREDHFVFGLFGRMEYAAPF